MKYEITFIDGSRKTIETEMSFGQYFNRYNQSQPFDEIDGVIINFANVLYIEMIEGNRTRGWNTRGVIWNTKD